MKYFWLVFVLVLPLTMFAQNAPATTDTQQGNAAATVPHTEQAPDARTLKHTLGRGQPGPNHKELRHKRDILIEHPKHEGRWWKNSDLVRELGISDAQVQQMDKIFLDSRIQLIDAKAAVEREEVRMQPLMESYNPDEKQFAAQIDKLASARAQLEKTNAMMLLAIRRVLTQEQWKKLQSIQSSMGPTKIVVPHVEGRFGRERD